MNLFGALIFAQNVYACDEPAGYKFIIYYVFISLIISFLAWLWLVIDIVRFEKANPLWFIGMFFVGFTTIAMFFFLIMLPLIFAIIYYFARKRPRDKKNLNNCTKKDSQNNTSSTNSIKN